MKISDIGAGALLPLAIFLAAGPALAASSAPDTLWTRALGSADREWGTSIAEADDGGLVVAGGLERAGLGRDIWLVKFDSAGELVWERTYGGAANDDAYAVRPTADGGYIIAARTESYLDANGDFWLIKTDGAGVLSWSRFFGGLQDDRAQYAEQTADGGYVVCGGTGDFTQNLMDVLLVRTDAAGNELWSRTYGGAGNEKAYAVRQTDGGFVLAGSTESFGYGVPGTADMWLVGTDADGVQDWSRTFGGTDAENAYALGITADGGFILAGYVGHYGSGTQEMMLVRTDADGNEMWSGTFGGAGDEVAYAIDTTADGGFIACGPSESQGAGGYDVLLVRTDAAGDELWRTTAGGAANDFAFSVLRTPEGGFAAAGRTESFGAGADDLYVVRFAPESGSVDAPATPRHGLGPIYPNPGNPSVTIRYDLAGTASVELVVLDPAGRRVRTIVDGDVTPAGRHEAVWTGRDQSGRPVAAGVYLFRLTAGASTCTARATLTK